MFCLMFIRVDDLRPVPWSYSLFLGHVWTFFFLFFFFLGGGGGAQEHNTTQMVEHETGTPWL